MCNTSMRPATGTTKEEENHNRGDTCIPHESRKSVSWAWVQHPKWEHPPLKAHPNPPIPSDSNPEAKANLSGKRDFAKPLRGAAAATRLRTPSSFFLACGGSTLLRFSPKEEAAGQTESAARRSLGGEEGGLSTRPQNSPNKAQRGPGGETGNKGKDSPQLFTPAWS